MTGQWRARVECDPVDFARDQVRILLAESLSDGRRMALPVKVELGDLNAPDVVADTGGPMDPFVVLTEGAALALFEALARHFIGTSDIAQLRRDLEAERRRVDALIAGIGRVGGVTA